MFVSPAKNSNEPSGKISIFEVLDESKLKISPAVGQYSLR